MIYSSSQTKNDKSLNEIDITYRNLRINEREILKCNENCANFIAKGNRCLVLGSKVRRDSECKVPTLRER